MKWFKKNTAIILDCLFLLLCSIYLGKNNDINNLDSIYSLLSTHIPPYVLVVNVLLISKFAFSPILKNGLIFRNANLHKLCIKVEINTIIIIIITSLLFYLGLVIANPVLITVIWQILPYLLNMIFFFLFLANLNYFNFCWLKRFDYAGMLILIALMVCHLLCFNWTLFSFEWTIDLRFFLLLPALYKLYWLFWCWYLLISDGLILIVENMIIKQDLQGVIQCENKNN